MSEYKNFYDKWNSFLSESPETEQLNELTNPEAKEIQDWMGSSTPEGYSFDNLFGNKMRVLIPLRFAEKNLLPSVKSIIGRVKALVELSDIWSVDDESLSRGSVYKINRPKDFGPELNLKRYKRETPPPVKRTEQKITKFLTQLGKSKKFNQINRDDLDVLSTQWGEQSDKLIHPQGSIIITRHPMDVARMADVDGIRSCHSPGSTHYKCAVDEAMGNAPVAYFVSKKQLDKLLAETGAEDIGSLDNQEIIFDKDRSISGVTPTSRLRLRKFTGKNIRKEDFELAVPEIRVYGNPTAHFRETVTAWALENQMNQITSDSDEAEKIKNNSWRQEYVETRYKLQTMITTTGRTSYHLEDRIKNLEDGIRGLFPDLVDGDIKWHGGSHKDSHTLDMFTNFFGVSKDSASDPLSGRGPRRNDITEFFPAKFFEYIKKKYHTNSSVFPGSDIANVEAQIETFMLDFENSIKQDWRGEGGSHYTQRREGAYDRVVGLIEDVREEVLGAYDLILPNRINGGFLKINFENAIDEGDASDETWQEMAESERIPLESYMTVRFILNFPEKYQDFDIFIRKNFTPAQFEDEVQTVVRETVGEKAAEVWKYVFWTRGSSRVSVYDRFRGQGWELEFESYLGPEVDTPMSDSAPISENKRKLLDDLSSFKEIVLKKKEILENLKKRFSDFYSSQETDKREEELPTEALEEAKRGRKKLKRKKKDACYRKVRKRYSVWPSAYASGALVTCREMGAENWGNSSKNKKANESLLSGKVLERIILEELMDLLREQEGGEYYVVYGESEGSPTRSKVYGVRTNKSAMEELKKETEEGLTHRNAWVSHKVIKPQTEDYIDRSGLVFVLEFTEVPDAVFGSKDKLLSFLKGKGYQNLTIDDINDTPRTNIFPWRITEHYLEQEVSVKSTRNKIGITKPTGVGRISRPRKRVVKPKRWFRESKRESKKKKVNEDLDLKETLESMTTEALKREILEEKKKKSKKKGRKLTQKASSESNLGDWFKRKGAKGKKSGWVDCNTCRKDKKTGRKKCLSCGRSDGEKRAKYPSCRPTPGACGQEGKGKKWGKKSKKSS